MSTEDLATGPAAEMVSRLAAASQEWDGMKIVRHLSRRSPRCRHIINRLNAYPAYGNDVVDALGIPLVD